jgi:hypothetical protein
MTNLLAHPTTDPSTATPSPAPERVVSLDRIARTGAALDAAVAAHPSARRPTRRLAALRPLGGPPRTVAPAPIGVVRFESMGAPVTIRVVATGPERLLARGRARSAELERRWSRPWHSSATARLAAAVASHREADLAPPPAATLLHTDVVLDAVGAELQVPPDGGGRALLADLVADELGDEGALGVAVQVGRVVRVLGDGPTGPWTIGVHAPWAKAPLAQLRLRSGAVAVAGVLDPRGPSGATANGQWTSADGAGGRLLVAAVVTGEAWRAELLAAAVLHAGAREGIEILAEAGAGGVLIDASGVRHRVGEPPEPRRLSG